MKRLALAAGIAALAMQVSTASAALITPTSISSAGTAVEFFTDETNLINGSGLSGTLTFANYSTITHASVAAGNAWVTDDPTPAGGDYYAQTSATVVFEIDFDQVYGLSDLVFWGYHFNANNGNEARTFQLEFSTDGGTSYGTPVTVGNPIGTYAASGASTFNFGSQINANAVRMTVTDNQFGGTAAGGDRVGLGEIRFLAVPEPTTLALLGLAGPLGLLRRRRA